MNNVVPLMERVRSGANKLELIPSDSTDKAKSMDALKETTSGSGQMFLTQSIKLGQAIAEALALSKHRKATNHRLKKFAKQTL